MIDLNKLSLGVLAGLLTGLLVGGLGARVAMRLVAMIAEIPIEFTVGGTVVILLVGAILGIFFGVIYNLLKQFVPLHWIWQGLLYGIILLMVFVVPPFFSPQGEFVLASPQVGLLLFGPIPVLYGLGLAGLTHKLEQRYLTDSQRTVNLVWPVLLGFALFLNLNNLGGYLEDARSYYPPLFFQWLQALQIPAQSTVVWRQLFLLAVLILYCGLALFIFWRGWHHWMARFTSVTLLIFSAAYFQPGSPLSATMNTFALSRLLPGLLQVAGLGLLLTLFYLFPNGKFSPRWTKAVAVIWWSWLLLWLINPFNIAWPETLEIMIAIGGLVSGVLAQISRYRRTPPLKQRQVKSAVVGFTLAAIIFGLLGVAVLAYPDLAVRHVAGLSRLLAFTVYWLPWLLIPAGMTAAIVKYGLWATDLELDGQGRDKM